MRLSPYIPGTAAWRARHDERLCHETGDRIQELVDEGLVPPGAIPDRLQRHLAACRRCGGEAEVYRQLKRAIARVGGDADPDLVERLRDFARRLPEDRDAGA